MSRAPYNILAIPYRRVADAYEFAVFERADGSMWQFIAGGGEGCEAPASAAQREAWEEAGISGASDWTPLDSRASIPRTAFPNADWPSSLYVVPEICFAVNVETTELRLSSEHRRVAWLDQAAAHDRLTWDSNRVALWELTQRLNELSNRPVPPMNCVHPPSEGGTLLSPLAAERQRLGGGTELPYLSLDSDVFDRSVTLRQSYQLLIAFVAQYHARGESSTVALLSDIGAAPDGTSCDPAQVHDFVRVAGELLGDPSILDAPGPA